MGNQILHDNGIDAVASAKEKAHLYAKKSATLQELLSATETVTTIYQIREANADMSPELAQALNTLCQKLGQLKDVEAELKMLDA